MQIKLIFFGKIILGENMKHEIDLKKYEIRTDLVIDLLGEKELQEISVKEEKIEDIKVTDVSVLEDENPLNKKKGRYITISFKDVTDKDNQKKLEDVLISYLKDILKNEGIIEDDKALVVGLGNSDSTPDSREFISFKSQNHLYPL